MRTPLAARGLGVRTVGVGANRGDGSSVRFQFSCRGWPELATLVPPLGLPRQLLSSLLLEDSLDLFGLARCHEAFCFEKGPTEIELVHV